MAHKARIGSLFRLGSKADKGAQAADENAQPVVTRGKSAPRKSFGKLQSKSKSSPEDLDLVMKNVSESDLKESQSYSSGLTAEPSSGGIRASMMRIGSRPESSVMNKDRVQSEEYGSPTTPTPNAGVGASRGPKSRALQTQTSGVRSSLRRLVSSSAPASSNPTVPPPPREDLFTEEFSVPLNDAFNSGHNKNDDPASDSNLVSRKSDPSGASDSMIESSQELSFSKERDIQHRSSGRSPARGTSRGGAQLMIHNLSSSKSNGDKSPHKDSKSSPSGGASGGPGLSGRLSGRLGSGRLSGRFGRFPSGGKSAGGESEKSPALDGSPSSELPRTSSGRIRSSMTLLGSAISGNGDGASQKSIVSSASGNGLGKKGQQPFAESASSGKHSKEFYTLKAKKAETFSAPAMMLAPYGVLGAGMDLLAVPHNAIRNELKDVYYALSVLDRMFTNITPNDVDTFIEYWDMSSAFIREFLKYEVCHLFPALERHGVGLEHTPMNKPAREAQALKISEALDVMDDAIDGAISYLPPFERAIALRRYLYKVTTALLEYFAAEEKILPALIDEKVTVAQVAKLEECMFETLQAETERGYAFAHMLVRWTSGAQRDFLMKRHFKKKARVFVAWGKEFNSNHLELLRKLNEKSKALVQKMDLDADFEAEKVPEYAGGRVQGKETQGQEADELDDDLKDGDLVEVENADGSMKFMRFVKDAPDGEHYVEVDVKELNVVLGPETENAVPMHSTLPPAENRTAVQC
eukprot:CAMPEP_0185848462 /NCGR_PEP_ID=MMETSP1354-20130828/3326_1 /TAXON_ID=708628 /ORGANISM="Erythrolobus madagascarensis, Strain CCMP3276" /LENGTH=750 /DNA_ID=CAMNT_0028548855 /DNA_START=65 /DNA_END=2317 /DNA_ORIENTATION=+